MSESIIIVGAGIAGLATGCCAQMNGYHLVQALRKRDGKRFVANMPV